MKGITSLIVFLIGIFFVSTTRTGTSWGDDWTMFAHHAKNIAEGKKYDDNVFIYNPSYPTYSPKAYSPGFPFILAPFYLLFGLNIAVLKIPVITLFIFSLVLFALQYRKEFSQPVLVSMIVLIGLCPFCWDSKDYILSDFPLMFSVLLCSWLVNKYYTQNTERKYYLLIGLAIYISYAIKPLGALFIPALFLFDIIKERKITLKFVQVSGVFLLFFILQSLIIPGSGSYIELAMSEYHGKNIKEISQSLALMFKAYRLSFSDFWLIHSDESAWRDKGLIFSNIFLILVGIGLVYRLIRKFSPTEMYVVFYIIIILLFPGFQGVRYFVPVLPFFFVSIFGLAEWVTSNTTKYLLLLLIVAPLGLFYTSTYLKAEWKNITWGIHEPTSQNMFAYIKKNTPEDAVLVGSKPRAIALYADRKAAVYPWSFDKNDFKEYMKSIHAGFALTTGGNDYFNNWVETDTANFQFIYNSDYLKLFKTKF